LARGKLRADGWGIRQVLSDDDAPFVWDQCLPDQMFVYNPTHLNRLVDAVTCGIKPGRSAGKKPIPANVVFLSARYAHHFCSDEMLDTLLGNVLDKIREIVTSAKDDLAVFAFWLANTTVLLYYLRRDSGLATATLNHQERLSELIASTYRLLVREAEARLYRILDESIIEFEPIPGLTDGVRFERERRSIFGIGLSRAESPPPTSATAGSAGVAVESSEAAKGRLRSLRESALFRRPHGGGKLPRCPSPKTVTTLYSSILFLLRAYHVHPWLVRDVLSQLFYYMSVVLFNRVLTNPGLRCRSRAMQIRINVSAIEDWARANRAPPETLAHLTPLVELLQFLQCLTQLGDLATFLETRAKLQSVTPMQIRKVVEGYRYEVREERVPEEVRQYVVQVAEDTETRDRETRAEMARKSEERGMPAPEQPPGSPADAGSGRETGEANEPEEPSTGDRCQGETPPAVQNTEGAAAEVLTGASGEGELADQRPAICNVAAPRVRHAPVPLNLAPGTDAIAPPPPRPRRSLAAFSVSTPPPSADLLAPDSPLQEVKDADYLLPFAIPRDRDFAEGWRGRARRRSGGGGRERVSWLDNPAVPSGLFEILDASGFPRL
ncbi:MAG: DIL domain-containing protein, partial [Olpidium bornovanus]